MWKEWQYALRLLSKAPGFTALTLFVLAAGLGVSVYMYSLIRTLAYADLPFPESERMVLVNAVMNGYEQGGNSLANFNFLQLAESQTTFEIFTRSRKSDITLTGANLPLRVPANYNNHELFALTEVPALLGRSLQAADSEPGAPLVTVLSYQVWQSEFNGSEDIIGRKVRIDDIPATIVGVMPAGYAFPDFAQLWLPMAKSGVSQPGDGPYLSIVGRLRDGVSIAEADAELKAIMKKLEQQHPATNANLSVKVWPFAQSALSNSMTIIAVMSAAAGLIMLLVILNAGNLLLARAAERQKEVAIRNALGAPRWRLIRQMLWEALLLAMAGGFIGVFFASWALDWSRQHISAFNESIPFWWTFEFSNQDLLFALLLTVLTALAVGLYPAWRASATNINQFLRDGTRGAQGLRMTRMTHVLVIAEIALSITLLIASLAMVASTHQTMKADYGARTNNVLIGEIDLYTQKYDDQPSDRYRFAEKLQALITGQPGVEGIALGCHLPGMYGPIWTYLVEGRDVPDKKYPSATRVVVTDNYFSLFRIKLVQGRLFDPRDQEDSERVVIISEQFAEKNWPGQSPIGKRIGLDRDHDPNNEKWYTVIGVVSEAMYGQPFVDFAHYNDMYLSLRQFPVEDLVVAIATEQEPMTLARNLASDVARIDTDIPVNGAMPLTERIYRYNAGMVFVSKLFLAMAALGVLLAASGIYGVIARSVALRTQELGIRRALGASERRVVWQLIQQGGYRLAIGAVIGVSLGLLLVEALRGVLYGIDGEELNLTLAVLLLVSLIVAAATLWPARRAVNLSPATALRYE